MNMSEALRPRPVRRPAEAGPPLPLVAAVTLGLFVAGIVVPSLMANGGAFPSPFSEDGDLRTHLAAHSTAVRIGSLFHFAASVPLAVFTASAVARLHALGVRAAGPSIALAGGVLASASLATSACALWVLSRVSPGASPEVARAIRDFAFAAGGPWHVVGLGLLLAGLAVPAGFYRLLPRPVWMSGIALAVVGELATLTFVSTQAAYLIPVARFGGLIWIVTAGWLLPRSRPRTHLQGEHQTTGDAETPTGTDGRN